MPRKVARHATVTVARPVRATQKSTSPNFVTEQDIVSGTDKVLVEPGDSLWKLAKRYIGDGTRWLAELNPQLDNPNLIRMGEWILVPSSEARGTKQVVVRAGHTLWSGAQSAWGSPLAVQCIVHANPQLQSADLIRPGQTLTLPQTCGVAP
jgi:nucleoid-associated protein YgaU